MSAAALPLLALLCLPVRAGEVDEHVDQHLTQPILKEVEGAAKDLGHAGETTTQPTWGAWAQMPTSKGARKILDFFDQELVQPLFGSANAHGVAHALASSDPNATAATSSGVEAESFEHKVLKLIGFGTADPLSLDLAPDQVVKKKVDSLPGEPVLDSTKFVKSGAGGAGGAGNSTRPHLKRK